MSGPQLDEKVVLLHRALAEDEIPHAFGGALALAYYGEPRGTIDIDVNVFVSPDESGVVLDALSRAGVSVPSSKAPRTIERDGQVRLWWGPNPVDLFFAYDEFHAACARRVREVPFGEERIPILSPEDLVVFKTLFGRRKDWIDIEQILFAVDADLAYVRDWLDRMLPADDARRREVETAIGRVLGS